MGIRTRIAAMAKERGLTAAAVARTLHLYRANLSAMDAGRRSVSLKALGRIATLLSCSPADLLEVRWGSDAPPFRRIQTLRRLRRLAASVPDGVERGWVHAALLAWQRHYSRSRRNP